MKSIKEEITSLLKEAGVKGFRVKTSKLEIHVSKQSDMQLAQVVAEKYRYALVYGFIN